MKINVLGIVLDHFDTLKSQKSRRVSIVDWLIFLALPVTILFAVYDYRVQLDDSFYNASITFFGIFVALLLNIQVAAFAIHTRQRPVQTDNRMDKAQNKKLDERRQLLGELNTNLSYLILVCCFALVIFLTLYSLKSRSAWWSAFSIGLYAHFLLTLLMVVKRSHALFQGEYRAKV